MSAPTTTPDRSSRRSPASSEGDIDPPPPSAGSPLKRSSDGYFQCGFCKKHYNRADHLIRHVRSHTREKPYGCHVCNKGFSRPDLLKRHFAGHMQRRDGKRKRRSTYANNGRVSQACTSCASSKLKCDEEKPCRRCRERNWTCTWPQFEAPVDIAEPESTLPEGNNLPTPVSAQTNLGHENSPMELDQRGGNPRRGRSQINSASSFPASEMPSEDAPAYNASSYIPVASPMIGGATVSSTSDHDSGVLELGGAFFPDFLADDFVLSLHRSADMTQNEMMPDSGNAYGIAGYNMQSDFDLDDVDFGFIQSFNEKELFQAPRQETDSAEDPNKEIDVDSGIALGAEAYRKSSLANWKPGREEHGYADHANLSVPKSIDSPGSPAFSDYKVLSEPLSQSSRDLVFGMILKSCRRANRNRIMSSFPSTEMLDSLLQQFFESHVSQIDTWIHVPTFEPNGQCSELLAAVAAAGAVNSPIPPIRKLGYALLEIVRLQLPVRFEDDNTRTRDLRLLQTNALILDIGLWSGNPRKTEIAEAFGKPAITMLRRTPKFKRTLYTPISLKDEQGEALEKKWRDWVEMESFKRLVYHLFLHDAQASLALNINPVISYSELELPFPAIRQLWEARTATEWRDIYISQAASSTRLPSLSDALQDMSQLTTFQHHIDLQLSSLIVSYGLSALISEYHRMRSISGGSNSRHWQALIIHSRHQELYEALQHLAVLSREWHTPPAPLVVLVQEVTAMFLHMSLEDLQIFAGKEDKKAARRVYHNALEWIKSPDSRRAVYHAGQALQASTKLPASAFGGFPAIAVYYASLTLWSYGVISRAKDTDRTNPSNQTYHYSNNNPILSSTAPIVYLNEPKTIDVESFIAFGRGIPALKSGGNLHQDTNTPVFLDDPSTIMHIGHELLRANRQDDETLPLVQSLCQLMHELGKAAQARRGTSSVVVGG